MPASRAVQAIRTHIRIHDMTVCDTLPGEGQFATDLGVSRAVMREAFGALAALRLIDVGNGRRARVGAMDGSVIAASLDHTVTTAQISVAEVWDVQRTIELRIVALAAQRRTDAQAARIMTLADAMRATADDSAQMISYDIAFHEAIVQAADNALFQQIVQSFAPLMQVAVPKAWQTRIARAQQTDTLDYHQAVAQAILDRDPAAAMAAMEGHFNTAIGDLLWTEAG